MKRQGLSCVTGLLLLILFCGTAISADGILKFSDGSFEGWTGETGIWTIAENPEMYSNSGDPKRFVISTLEKGEANVGTLRSEEFVIESPLQSFSIAGWDGAGEGNNGKNNFVRLRSAESGEILREEHTPGGNKLVSTMWYLPELMGKKVYLEVVDNNSGGGFGWIAFADYIQGAGEREDPVTVNVYALPIDENAEVTICKSVPFWAAQTDKRGNTKRQVEGDTETIPVGTAAKSLMVLGMINEGWDCGVAHWGEHMELTAQREDQVNIGTEIGVLEIKYADGKSDRVPVVMGATAWLIGTWKGFMEPFGSRPEYMQVLEETSLLCMDPKQPTATNLNSHYYLNIKTRNEKIESIVIHDNPKKRGRPLVSGINLIDPADKKNLKMFGAIEVEREDAERIVDSSRMGDFQKRVEKLADTLYTSEADLPEKVEMLEWPSELEGAKIRFAGGNFADMLTNVWIQNLEQIDGKFESDTGFFHESGKNYPWYAGYSGTGTWAPLGVYYGGAFGRCSDHFASLALRCIDDKQRVSSYVDYCDKMLYFYRDNNDPNKGPANDGIDWKNYPADAPPHWDFVISSPGGMPWQINEIPGDEETDGHGSTIVGRWVAWRMLGAPTDEWLMAARENVYGKSRWDSTKEAAEFICWLMDYTGRDVMWTEGETNSWAQNDRVPVGMATETDPIKIKENYANADMYEPYPTWVCNVALRCSAQIAEKIGEKELAEKWQKYAKKLRDGMVRQMVVDDRHNRMWRVSFNSTYPSLQDSLVHAWFSIYLDGLDSANWDKQMTEITRNTYERQVSQLCGKAPVLAMGYGQGWLTKSALLLDEMDDAGEMLCNIARYSYDKNMDYMDESRGIDWRKYMWLVPEGTNILPDGSWYRIGDLTNGANQGIAMHALELCAGVDDTNPADLKIIPRAPQPLEGLEVEDFPVLVPDGAGLKTAKVDYKYVSSESFVMTSDTVLPVLSVRMGPFESETKAKGIMEKTSFPAGSTQRIASSGHVNGEAAQWIWIEGMKDVKEVKIELND